MVTRSCCLVRQLFRAKGLMEPDNYLLDEMFFPYILPEKHPPKLLLQDIKLTRSSFGTHDDYGNKDYSAIRVEDTYGQVENSVFFTEEQAQSGSPVVLERRLGSVDIINRLRSLELPNMYNTSNYDNFIGEKNLGNIIQISEMDDDTLLERITGPSARTLVASLGHPDCSDGPSPQWRTVREKQRIREHDKMYEFLNFMTEYRIPIIFREVLIYENGSDSIYNCSLSSRQI